MISAKRILTFFLIVLPLAALAEGVSFDTTGDDIGEDTLPALKQKAVVNYLQKQMGSRYAAVAEQVTPEFAENYILDYQVGRKGKLLEVTGHIDAKSLMRWVRLQETRSKTGGSIRTALVISAEYPQVTLDADKTNLRLQDNNSAKAVLGLAQATVEKFNVSLAPVDSRFPLSQPAKGDSDLRSLRDYGSSASVNTVLWAQLTPCSTCGGTKVTLYFYNLFQDRAAAVVTRNAHLDATQVASGTGVREALAPAFEQLAKDLEDVISSGTLSSRIYRVVIENIKSYKGFRLLQQEMSKLDFVARATLKRTEPFVAEYEIFSPMAAAELSARFQGVDFEGFQLAGLKADNTTVTLKFQPK